MAGAILCAAASLLLLLCALHLFAGGGGLGAGLPSLAGVGLLLAAVKSFRESRRGV